MNPAKLIVVGHSFGGEIAKALLSMVDVPSRGLIISPAGRRRGKRFAMINLLAYLVALKRKITRGVSLKQALRYIRILRKDYVPPPRNAEIIYGMKDRFVTIDWREEHWRGGHFPLDPKDLAKRIAELAARLD